MEQKVCLDTDVVIAILNNEPRAAEIIQKIENATVFITVVTLFELLLRKTRLDAIERFRNTVYVLNFDEEAARKASSLFKELQEKGKMIDFRDIFIAAICFGANCSLSTFNKKHFVHMRDLKLM